MSMQTLTGLLMAVALAAGTAFAEEALPPATEAEAPAAPAPETPSRTVTGDNLIIEETATPKPRPANLPTRGMTMSQVRARFGEPLSRHGPIGQPPITRWEYAEFRVVFEHSHVLTAVVPGAPSQIHHREQLQPK